MFPANELSENLRRLGIELKRFKTGTPARVHADTLDYSKMELEEGDEKIVPFSFETENVGKNLVPCYLVYTNEKTKLYTTISVVRQCTVVWLRV